MADRISNFANAFETTLASEMNATALTATVATTGGGPTSPCYLVIEPDSAAQREYVYFDGTFTGTTFVATVIGNRYLAGSAAGSGLTHPAGSVVRSVPAAQHFVDLHDRITAGGAHGNLTGVTSDQHHAKSHAHDGADGSGTVAHADLTGLTAGNPHTQYLPRAGVTALTPTTGAVTVDFSSDDYRTHALTGNVTYGSSNLAAGRSVAVRVTCDGTGRTLAFPAGWKFVGAKPADIAAGKVAVLSLTSFGTTDADVVAAYAVEA